MSGFAIQGFSYSGWTGAGGFDSLGSKLTLDRMAQDGANTVAVAGWSATVASGTASTVVNDKSYVSGLAHVLYDAEARGLDVVLKPQLTVADGSSTTALAPSDPAAFFASYKAMLLDYAALAQQYHVQSLSLGNELDGLVTSQYASYWMDIIAAVRGVYSGQITYAASYANPAGTAFLSQLDYIGVNPYLALSTAAHPTEADLVAGWTTAPAPGTWQSQAWGGQSYRDYLLALSKSTGKPIVFTEVGYASGSHAAADPGNAANPGTPDPGLQAALYKALFTVWAPYGDAVKGALLWTWSPVADPKTQDPNWATSYDVRGKAAEAVVRDAFGGTGAQPAAPAGSDVVKVTVNGTSWQGAPELVLAVNGLIVGRTAVTADALKGEWQDVSFAVHLSPGAQNRIEVYFANDAYGGAGQDRNLFVKSLSVNGAAQAVSEAKNDAGWMADGTAVMAHEGSLSFALAGQAPSGPVTQTTLNPDGTKTVTTYPTAGAAHPTTIETVAKSGLVTQRENFDASGAPTTIEHHRLDGTHAVDFIKPGSELVAKTEVYKADWTLVSRTTFNDAGLVTQVIAEQPDGTHVVSSYAVPGGRAPTAIDSYTANWTLTEHRTLDAAGTLLTVDRVAADGTHRIETMQAGTAQPAKIELYSSTSALLSRTLLDASGHVTSVQEENADGSHRVASYAVPGAAHPSAVDTYTANWQLTNRVTLDAGGHLASLDRVQSDGSHVINSFAAQDPYATKSEVYDANWTPLSRTTYDGQGHVTSIDHIQANGGHEVATFGAGAVPATVDLYDASWGLVSRTFFDGAGHITARDNVVSGGMHRWDVVATDAGHAVQSTLYDANWQYVGPTQSGGPLPSGLAEALVAAYHPSAPETSAAAESWLQKVGWAGHASGWLIA